MQNYFNPNNIKRIHCKNYMNYLIRWSLLVYLDFCNNTKIQMAYKQHKCYYFFLEAMKFMTEALADSVSSKDLRPRQQSLLWHLCCHIAKS